MGRVRPHLLWTVCLIAAFLALLALPLHLNSSSAAPMSDGLSQAGPTTFSGNLGTCDPTYNRAFNVSVVSITGSNVFYEFQEFTVGVTGVYTLSMTSTTIADAHASIYRDSFNPAVTLMNIVFVDDDSGTGVNPAFLNITLDAGVTYILVTSTLNNGFTGSYTWTLSGAGAYTLGANSITLGCSTATPTSTATATATPTFTGTASPSATSTSTDTPTSTTTPSATSTFTGTASPSATPTSTDTSTGTTTATATSTFTGTASPSATATSTGTLTETATSTSTDSSTSTATATVTSTDMTVTSTPVMTTTASATPLRSQPLCTTPLPVGAIQGRLLSLTPGLFSPDPRSTTDVLLPAGSSWWIIETAPGYYRLWIACEATPVWVSAFLVTPNYDEVWQGNPLP